MATPPPEPVIQELIAGIAGVVPFIDETARLAGNLRLQTKALGLSLGDRACLATAVSLQAVACTADRAWASLQVGCAIEVIR